ncbi:MAG: TadE/TadG family type IV pilus assembly protein [Paracoccaceae bacterium]
MGAILQKVKGSLRRFARNEEGLASAEMILMLPLYLFCIIGTFTYFDAYDVVNRSQKASYTVSDLITRKQDEVTEGYVNGLFSTMQYMMGPSLPVKTRITSVFYDGSDDEYEVIWSRSSYPGIPELNSGTILSIQSHLPVMADGDALVVVEANIDFKPILGAWSPAQFAFEEGVMKYVVVTRPRFLPKICMSGVACG